MNSDEFLRNPRIQKLSPEKRQIISEFIADTKGMSIDMAIPALLRANAKMKSMGISFTKDESDLLFDLIAGNMPATDRAKIEALRKLAMR